MIYMRQAKSFTISDEILIEIANTKGTGSTSERVNELLRRALELERRERLELEAAEFFRNDKDSVRERVAYQKASKEALSRG
jgi:Arc/MetJ family transcription regulator